MLFRLRSLPTLEEASELLESPGPLRGLPDIRQIGGRKSAVVADPLLLSCRGRLPEREIFLRGAEDDDDRRGAG